MVDPVLDTNLAGRLLLDSSDNISCNYVETDEITQVGGLTVLHLNIRSLNRNIQLLQEMICSLNKKGIIIDALLLCETWLNSENDSLVNIDGYTCINRNRLDGVGGGLAIYVLSDYSPTILDIQNHTHAGVYESLFVKIKKNSKELILGEVYRVPNSSQSIFQDFVKNLSLVLKGKTAVVGADQNLDLLKVSTHQFTRKFLDEVINMELIPVIVKPTRVTHQSSTLIDNLYVSADISCNAAASILVEHISDHFPCLVQINWPYSKAKSEKKIATRKLTEEKLQKINNTLLHKNWVGLLDIQNPINDNYLKFISEVQQTLSDVAPVQTKTFKGRNVLKQPWMTVNLLKCTKKARAIYLKVKNKPRSSAEWMRYANYRRCLVRLKNIARGEYVRKQIEMFKGDSRKIWNMINYLIKSRNDKSNIVSELVINGKLVNDQREICNHLNEHFATAGFRATKGCSNDENAHKRYLKNRVVEGILFNPCSETEIDKLVEQLPNKTSSGVDKISNVLLKRIRFSIRLPLMILVNQSLIQGIFPDELKIARVIALFKGGDKVNCDNYRPISLLNVISKILERAVHNRVLNFLNGKRLISDRQFGFRKGHSTIHAVQNLVGEIVSGFDKGMNCISLFLDIKKCFDSCNHSILISKLEHYGIRGIALNWFKSYLDKRTQFVEVDTCTYSEKKLVKIGLPQGSILGPLLMSIMNNDLQNCLKLSHCILFADDTTVFILGRNVRFLKIKMQREIELLSTWMSDNMLSVNVNKTKLMLFTPKGYIHNEDMTLKMNGQQVEFVNEFKFLGVWLDEHLTWKFHITELSIKLNRLKFVFRKLNRLLPVHCLRNMYFAYVHSRLLYGIIVWGTMCSKENFSSLINIQKCFVRLINKVSIFEESSPLFLKNKILKLQDSLDLELLKQMFQYQNHTLPPLVQKLYRSKSHNYGTRNNESPNIESHKSSIYNSSFLCKAVTLWDKCHANYRVLTTIRNVVKVFKYKKFSLY